MILTEPLIWLQINIMNTIKTTGIFKAKGLLLGAAMLGAFTVSTVAPASAQPRMGQRPRGRAPQRIRTQNFVGQVTKVKSNQSFDINVRGTIYNVYANWRLPRRISSGDRVQVRGIRQDKNDIRNATVTVLRNR